MLDLRSLPKRVLGRLFPEAMKHREELAYWRDRQRQEGTLSNRHYKFFYTTHFGLTDEDWADKVVLDIGCGPRGSLEWADMTRERYGLDPLAEDYLKLGADRHKMTYVAAPSEDIPFPDGTFDIVTSFNNIDHVDDIDATLKEIIRILKAGGLFLLLTDVGHDPTPTEPNVIDFDIVGSFAPHLELLQERHYEKTAPGLYDSILADVAYRHSDGTRRYGILSAKFRKL